MQNKNYLLLFTYIYKNYTGQKIYRYILFHGFIKKYYAYSNLYSKEFRSIISH